MLLFLQKTTTTTTTSKQQQEERKRKKTTKIGGENAVKHSSRGDTQSLKKEKKTHYTIK